MRRPILHGLLCDLLLYALMQYVVVPLSAADAPVHQPWASIVVHMTLVGVPCALFARRALHTRPTSLPAVA